MKKVINIILLVVLGVSLSGCEWWDEPGFGVDGGIAHTFSMDSIMTEIAQYGCEGEVVNFFSFVVGRNNMEDGISPVINMDNTYVKFDAMKKDGKDAVAMNVKINGKDDAFKFYYGGDPVRGVKMESFIETVYTFGSKYDNNHSYEWKSEFFLWDAFEFKGDKYIVLSASKPINIEFYSHKGQILESEEVKKIINEGEKDKDFKEISVMGSMSGVDKTAYVIDNRVYIRNSYNNRWSYFCNYSAPSMMSTNIVETMILIKVKNLLDNNSSIVSVKKENGKYYFTQSRDPRNVNRFFLINY